MAAEKNVENHIRAHIEARGGWVVKIHGSEFQTGVPDLLVCYKGQFIALETKAPAGDPSGLQIARIRKIRRAGGIAEVIYSIGLLEQILDTIDRGEAWIPRPLKSTKPVLKLEVPMRLLNNG